MKPDIFDRSALLRHRKRHRPKALFLHERACDQIKERLAEVNRAFKRRAIVTGHPEFWSNAMPEAEIFADSEVLELDVAQYDLVIHAMALHAANDPVGQLIQCRRALVPDGLFLAVSFGGQTLAELRSVFATAEAEVSGGLSPRIAPLGDLRDLGALLQRAGFALPVADLDSLTVSYADFWSLLRELRDMGESNALAGRSRKFAPRRLFDRAAEIYTQHYTADDRLLASFEMIYLTGWAPSADQQQPLRPGSAQTRLATALNASEVSAGEPVEAAVRKNSDTPD